MKTRLLTAAFAVATLSLGAATKNIVPNADGDGGLGTASKKWREINAATGAFSGKLTLNSEPVATTNQSGLIALAVAQKVVSTNTQPGGVDTNTVMAIASSNLASIALRGTNAAGIIGADGTGTNRLGLLWPESLVGNWNIIWPTTNALDGQALVADVSGSNVFLYWSDAAGGGVTTEELNAALVGKLDAPYGIVAPGLTIAGTLEGQFLHLGPLWQVDEDPAGWDFGWNEPHLLGTNVSTGDWYQFDGQDPRSIATFEDVAAAVMDGTGKTLLVTPDIELDFDPAVTVDLSVTNAWNFHSFTPGNIDITVINPPAQRWFNIYIEGAAPIAESRTVTWTWPAGTVVRWADGVVANSVSSNATLVVSGYWRTATNVVLTGKEFK